jgi:hypothetical protein
LRLSLTALRAVEEFRAKAEGEGHFVGLEEVGLENVTIECHNGAEDGNFPVRTTQLGHKRSSLPRVLRNETQINEKKRKEIVERF